MYKPSILTVFLLLFMSSFCYGQKKLEPLTIWVNHPININYAPILIAQKNGYFKKNHLIVSLKRANKNVIQAILKQEKDIALTPQPDFLRQNTDYKIIRLGSMIDKPLSFLVALKSKRIMQLHDLKGKRIALDQNPISQILLQTMLKQAGLTLKDVKVITKYHQLARALNKGKVDAVLGHINQLNLTLLEANNKEIITFYPEDYGVPTYHELIIIGNKNLKNDDRIARLFASLKESIQFIDRNPNASFKHITKLLNNKNNHIDQKNWFDTIVFFNENPAEYNQNQWKTFAYFIKKQNLVANATQ